jgi:hypothetical protein
MSGSSSSSLTHNVEVSSSHRPQAARRDKTVGSTSRPTAPSVREDQRMARSRVTPSGTALLSRGGLRLVKSTLREGRRKGCRPPANSMTDWSAPTPTPCRGAGHGGGRRTQRRRQACRWQQTLALPRGVCSRYLSGAAEPQTFTCLLSPAGAMVRPRPSQRSEVQPPSARGRVSPPLR